MTKTSADTHVVLTTSGTVLCELPILTPFYLQSKPVRDEETKARSSDLLRARKLGGDLNPSLFKSTTCSFSLFCQFNTWHLIDGGDNIFGEQEQLNSKPPLALNRCSALCKFINIVEATLFLSSRGSNSYLIYLFCLLV